MLKRKKLHKLNRDTDARRRLFRQLIRSIAAKGQVVTSLAKAKAVRPQIEKLVTQAKNNSLTNLRRLIAKTGDMTTVRNLLLIGEVFKSRPGGYTRIVRLGPRLGDNSEQVKLEWVEQIDLSRSTPKAVKQTKDAQWVEKEISKSQRKSDKKLNRNKDHPKFKTE